MLIPLITRESNRTAISTIFIRSLAPLSFLLTLPFHLANLRLDLSQLAKIQLQRLSHPKDVQSAQHQQKPNHKKKVNSPSRPLPMIPNIVPRIRMHKSAQNPPPNHQPRHKGPKLLRREEIHLEHPDRMRTHGLFHQWVDPQFGEFTSNSLVQLAGIL